MRMKTVGALAASATLAACSALGPRLSSPEAKLEVMAAERAFAAPFSWEPEEVEVLDSGALTRRMSHVA